MNDIFIEQVVRKKRDFRQRVSFVAAILTALGLPALVAVLGVFTLHYLVIVSFFVLLFGIWFIWFFRSHQNYEFEYQMVGDTIVVSKVIAKRARKEMLKLDVHNIDILEKGSSDEINKINFVKTVIACEGEIDEKNTYCAVYTVGTNGKRGLFFDPNEKILGAMRPYLKKDIQLKLFCNRG